MSTRPRLLFLCQTLPDPPDGGVWIRTYHVLRLLARAFDITALCFERSAPAGQRMRGTTPAGTTLDRLMVAVEVFPLPKNHSRIRFAWDHARSLARRRVYTTFLYQSDAFRDRVLHHVASGGFNLVHVDSLDLAQYLPLCEPLPVVGVHHDIESDLLRRRATLESDRWTCAYLRYQSRLMQGVEHRWCERMAMNVVCSDRDERLLKRMAPAARTTVVPNGVDTSEFSPCAVAAAGVAFVGGTHPYPNFDALTYFSQEIVQHLHAVDPDIPVRWIGRATPEQQRHYALNYGVELTGYLHDVRPLMAAAACHIVPLRTGGGTRLKILNSWAMGKPVVSTSLGCEGLAAVDDDNILIRDDPKAFADAVLEVVHDTSLQQRLGQRGRETVDALYSWDAIAPGMIDSYLSIANVNSRRVVPIPAAVGREARYEHA